MATSPPPAERLIETADSYEQACARRRYWAAQIVRLGLEDGHGIYVRQVRLTGTMVTFGVYVGDHDAAESP